MKAALIFTPSSGLGYYLFTANGERLDEFLLFILSRGFSFAPFESVA